MFEKVILRPLSLSRKLPSRCTDYTHPIIVVDGHDRRASAANDELRPHRESARIVTRLLDDERPVDSVRASDPADPDELFHGVRQSAISSR